MPPISQLNKLLNDYVQKEAAKLGLPNMPSTTDAQILVDNVPQIVATTQHKDLEVTIKKAMAANTEQVGKLVNLFQEQNEKIQLLQQEVLALQQANQAINQVLVAQNKTMLELKEGACQLQFHCQNVHNNVNNASNHLLIAHCRHEVSLDDLKLEITQCSNISIEDLVAAQKLGQKNSFKIEVKSSEIIKKILKSKANFRQSGKRIFVQEFLSQPQLQWKKTWMQTYFHLKKQGKKVAFHGAILKQLQNGQWVTVTEKHDETQQKNDSNMAQVQPATIQVLIPHWNISLLKVPVLGIPMSLLICLRQYKIQYIH